MTVFSSLQVCDKHVFLRKFQAKTSLKKKKPTRKKINWGQTVLLHKGVGMWSGGKREETQRDTSLFEKSVRDAGDGF